MTRIRSSRVCGGPDSGQKRQQRAVNQGGGSSATRNLGQSVKVIGKRPEPLAHGKTRLLLLEMIRLISRIPFELGEAGRSKGLVGQTWAGGDGRSRVPVCLVVWPAVARLPGSEARVLVPSPLIDHPQTVLDAGLTTSRQMSWSFRSTHGEQGN